MQTQARTKTKMCCLISKVPQGDKIWEHTEIMWFKQFSFTIETTNKQECYTVKPKKLR